MKKNILKIFQDAGALLQGHFLLSSGLHSSQYLQCALVLQRPEYAQRLRREPALRFKDDNINVVIGLALGAVIVSYKVARALGRRSIFAERKNGKMKLRRSCKINRDDKVLVVEDVVTTDASTRKVIGGLCS